MFINIVMFVFLNIAMVVIAPNLAPISLLMLIGLLVAFAWRYIRYNRSSYQKLTGNSLWKVYRDNGLYGEFLIVSALQGIDEHEALLANLYLEKADKADETTEVDVVYINRSGIYVIESKNYGGWIFGDEKNLYWTQSLNARVKNKFYNPIKQNNGHISALLKLIGEQYASAVVNLVVFSERCELKKVNVISSDVKVLKRNSLRTFVKSQSKVCLTAADIRQIRNILLPRTNVSDSIKQKHIQNISKSINSDFHACKTSANTVVDNHTKSENHHLDIYV